MNSINIYDVSNDVIIVSIAFNNVVDMLSEPKGLQKCPRDVVEINKIEQILWLRYKIDL